MRISDSPRTRAKAMCDWVLELMQGSAEHESQCGIKLLRESVAVLAIQKRDMALDPRRVRSVLFAHRGSLLAVEPPRPNYACGGSPLGSVNQI